MMSAKKEQNFVAFEKRLWSIKGHQVEINLFKHGELEGYCLIKKG